jgi:hypothetical protein
VSGWCAEGRHRLNSFLRDRVHGCGSVSRLGPCWNVSVELLWVPASAMIPRRCRLPAS